jgi:predicted glycogen debranching enzyme
VNWRHFHSVTDRWKLQWEFVQSRGDKKLDLSFGTPKSTLIIKATDGHYHDDGKWVERVYYREEAMRGESCLDDCYQPGFFDLDVKANENENLAIVAIGDEDVFQAQRVLAEMPDVTNDFEQLLKLEIRRRENLLVNFYKERENVPISDWLNWIILATDTFIVKGINDIQRSVIAGYHWFECWGRDAFISLPGLMLATGRAEDARKVFLTFKKHFLQGLIPNFISDQLASSAYNSADATLWFVNAVLQYLEYTNDFNFVRDQLWETLKAIVENHVKGTMFNIHIDSDGLLSCDPQLTWMDATVDDQPITPRAGKAVEVQALWYNTLKIVELLAGEFKETADAERFFLMSERTRKSFVETFWDSDKNCLFDVITENGKDDSLRPNQIIAVALDFSMLDNVKNERVVDLVHRELSTPFGLRTLARSDSKYVGVYYGDRRSRDRAYHNGTVWPWLQGPFITAFLKTKGYADNMREYALKNFILELFAEQIFEVGLGTIGEILDGEQPHTPRGCISQAWSVAEPLRAYVEDVLLIRPKYEKEVLQRLR